MKWIILTLIIGMIKFAIPLLPMIMKYVDDLLINQQMTIEQKIQDLMWILAGTLVLFVVVRGPVEYLRQYFAQFITSRILFDMRNRLYAHLRAYLRYYQNTKVGEAISRFINDVEQSKNLVEVGMMNIWLDMFTLLFVLIVMFFMNPVLTLVAISILPLYGLAVNLLYKRLKRLTKDRSQALAGIQAYLHERIQGISVIRSFTLERYDQKKFEGINGNFLKKRWPRPAGMRSPFPLSTRSPTLRLSWLSVMGIPGNSGRSDIRYVCCLLWLSRQAVCAPSPSDQLVNGANAGFSVAGAGQGAHGRAV